MGTKTTDGHGPQLRVINISGWLRVIIISGPREDCLASDYQQCSLQVYHRGIKEFIKMGYQTKILPYLWNQLGRRTVSVAKITIRWDIFVRFVGYNVGPTISVYIISGGFACERKICVRVTDILLNITVLYTGSFGINQYVFDDDYWSMMLEVILECTPGHLFSINIANITCQLFSWMLGFNFVQN